MKTEGAQGPVESSPLSVIAAAGIGWKSHLDAKTFWNAMPCRECDYFEMQMIKSQESDSFGHLWPTCKYPELPGKGGQRTQPNATCDKWRSKASAEAGQ